MQPAAAWSGAAEQPASRRRHAGARGPAAARSAPRLVRAAPIGSKLETALNRGLPQRNEGNQALKAEDIEELKRQAKVRCGAGKARPAQLNTVHTLLMLSVPGPPDAPPS